MNRRMSARKPDSGAPAELVETARRQGIDIRGISHSIGAAEILHDVSAVLPKGKITALIGPNGAGKSTLLSLIGRLHGLQKGHIAVDGLDVSTTASDHLALRMAILAQHNSVASRLRVQELVSFGRWPHHKGRPGPFDRAAVADALSVFDLTALADRFLDELSGGQQQRAFLAMTFAQATDWMLLDEPLNNLDMAHSRALMRQLQHLKGRGRSVVVVVHEVNYAAAWADHVVAMKNGRIAAEGPPSEVLTPEILGALYDMELRVTEIDGRPMVLHHC